MRTLPRVRSHALAMPLSLKLTITTADGDTETSRFRLSENQGPTKLGRKVSTDGITLDHPSISRLHATFDVEEGRITVVDHSMNGTWINGIKMTKKADEDLAVEDLRLDDVRASLPCALCCVLHGRPPLMIVTLPLRCLSLDATRTSRMSRELAFVHAPSFSWRLLGLRVPRFRDSALPSLGLA